MKILAIITGEYGVRHIDNIRAHAPAGWSVHVWKAPSAFPLIIDYPEDFIPKDLPQSDLILSLAETKAIAELIPDLAQMIGAKAVIMSVDSEAWLPRGLSRQLRGWLERINVAYAGPKPLCSLTEKDYKVTKKEREAYDSPIIAEFARYFGQPQFEITVDPETRTITSAQVKVDAVCGCARHVAEKLIGLSADEAGEKAGLAHHHFPCLASMVKLNDYNHDTLMHESGHLLVDNIEEQIKPFKSTRFVTPGELSE
jgi:hypothetical protein